MSFLAPILLAAAIAIAIPIILHLINFRRPNKQAFSTLVFFQQLKKSSIRWLKIKKLILLALRIAAILLLVFALARPVLSPGFSVIAPDRGSVLYAVMIENGPAMSQIDERGPQMEAAKTAVEKILDGARANDRFLIYNTHGSLAMPDEVSANQARRVISGLESVNKGNFTENRLSQLISRALATDRDAAGLYIVSRGGETLKQKLDDFEPPSGFRRELMPLTFVKTGGEQANNVGITEVEVPNQIVSVGRPLTVRAGVRNYGDTRAVNLFLSLEVNGDVSGQYQVELDPGDSREFSFEIEAPEAGFVQGRVVLEGDAFAHDNVRYFTIEVPETRSILLVTREPGASGRQSWLEPVFKAAGRAAGQIDVQKTNWNDIENHRIDTYDAVILEGVREVPEFIWNDIQRFVQQGGGLVFIPGGGGSPDRINPFLERINAGRFTGLIGESGRYEAVARVDRLVRGHPILDEIFDVSEDEDIRIDLPNLYHYWRYSTAGSSAAQTILRTNLDDPLLVQHTFGEGIVLVSATSTDPDWSAFAVNPFFAPLFYRVGLYAAAGESGGLNQFILGSNFDWLTGRDLRQSTLELNDISLAPEFTSARDGIRLQSETYEWEPGIARISSESDTLYFAVNQSISESRFGTLTQEELNSIFAGIFSINRLVSLADLSDTEIAARLGAAGTGREVWNWFILFAVVILVAESIVAKKFRGDQS